MDREEVARLLGVLASTRWEAEGRVAALVETPEPHRHAERDEVTVVEGEGFAGDHERKCWYRGRYQPGREVSAVTLEVLRTLGVDPAVVGDNLITEGVDLGALEEGDELRVGDDVVLERSHRAHRPCRTFRDRTSPEALAVVSRDRHRGALFVVRRGGRIRRGDPITVVPRGG